MIKGIKNTLTGLRIIRDMFGESGKPEPIHIAQVPGVRVRHLPQEREGRLDGPAEKGSR